LLEVPGRATLPVGLPVAPGRSYPTTLTSLLVPPLSMAGKLQRNPNVVSEAFVDMPQQFVASSPNSPETLLTSVNRTS